jgi:hypothetical protein
VTYPNQILQEGKYKALPDHVTKVVAVMHDRDHYAVMEIIRNPDSAHRNHNYYSTVISYRSVTIEVIG